MSSTKNKRSIIGIAGAFGSGKSTAAAFFEKKGYKSITLSSFLEVEAEKRKLQVTRKNLQDIGNELRDKYGPDILMKMALQKITSGKIVIDGIRNYGELIELKKVEGSIILGILVDRNVRFERLKLLKRREKLTKELFEKLDLRDLGVGEKITGLQTAICIALADVYIHSNGEIKDLHIKLENFLKNYEKTTSDSN